MTYKLRNLYFLFKLEKQVETEMNRTEPNHAGWVRSWVITSKIGKPNRTEPNFLIWLGLGFGLKPNRIDPCPPLV